MSQGIEQGTSAGVAEPVKRGGCLKKGCGCGAFFLGATVVLLAFAPRLAGGLVAEVMEDEFDELQGGSLEIPTTALAWTERQRVEGVRLLDPQAREVARLSVEVPSIADLVEAFSKVTNGGVIDLGTYRVSVEGDVVVDENGRSNLEAALAPKRKAPEGIDVIIIEGPRDQHRRERDAEDFLKRAKLTLELDCPRLTYTDPRLAVEGNRVALHAVRGELRLVEGGSVSLEVHGEQECETRGSFSLEAGAAGFSAEHELLPSTWQVRLAAESLSGALVDRLSDLQGEVGSLLGESFTVEAAATGAFDEPERADFQLRSDALRLAASGALSEGRFALVEKATVLELDPEVAAERVRTWSARVLPEGMAIVVPDEGLPLELRELTFEVPLASDDPLRDARLGLDLAVGAFSVRDPFQKGSAEVLPLAGVELSAHLAPGVAPEVRVATGFVDQPGSAVVLTAKAKEALTTASVEAGAGAIPLAVTVAAEGIPVDRLRRLAGEEEAWEELVGGRVALTAETTVAQGAPLPLELTVRSDHAELVLAGVLEHDQRLHLTGDGLTGALRVPKPVFADLAREYVPEGRVLSSREAELPIGLRIEALDIDLAKLQETRSLAGASLRFGLELGAVDYTEELLAKGGQQLALETSTLSAELEADGQLVAKLTSKLNDSATGSLEVDVTCARGAELLGGGDPAAIPLALEAKAKDFPTKIVDLYTGQDGLLVDVLGPRLQVTARSDALTTAGGPVVAHASSDLGTFDWKGTYRDGVIESGEGGRLEVTAGLSPLFSQRVVGPLVPLLVDVKKGDAAPVLLHGTDLRLPLDGDLSGLDGKLRLELGQITCALLPGLAAELPGLASKVWQETWIEPIDLSLVKGVVRYDRLPVKIDGRPIVFAGGYDLASGALDLSTDVRLGDLGGEAGKLLQSVRKALGEDYAVPLRLGGTVKSPRVSLAPGFLEQAVQDAGKKAVEDELEKHLKKGLKDLLGG